MRELMIKLGNELLELKEIDDNNLAKRIAREVSKMFSK